jgi:hypothetical protein
VYVGSRRYSSFRKTYVAAWNTIFGQELAKVPPSLVSHVRVLKLHARSCMRVLAEWRSVVGIKKHVQNDECASSAAMDRVSQREV